MAGFDIEGARQAGYSDDEIGKFLLALPGTEDARKAGYSDEQILDHFGLAGEKPKAETAKPATEQMTGIKRTPALIGSKLVEGAAKGVGSVGDIEHIGNQFLPEFMTRPIASFGNSDPEARKPQQLFPTSNDLVSPLNRAGITNRPDLVPQDNTERLIAAGAEGVGTAVPFMATGGGSAILPTAAAGLGAGLASEGAAIAYPDSPGVQAAAGLAGGIASGTVGSVAQRGVNYLRGSLGEAGQQVADAGIPQRSAALSSDSKGTQKALGSAAPAEKIEQDLGTALESTAGKLGGSRTLQEAGTELQDQARHWLENTMPAKLDSFWKPVDAAIPKDTQLPLTNFQTTLASLTGKGGNLQDVIKELTPRLPERLLKSLNESVRTERLKAPVSGEGEKMFVMNIADRTRLPVSNWNDVKELRSALGEAIGNPSIVKDIPEKQLNALYAALTTDMREAAGRVGPDALEVFDAANASSTKLYKFAEGTLSKVVKGVKSSDKDPNPEQLASTLISGGRKGGTDLAALRAELGTGVDELAAAHLRQIGLHDAADSGSVVSKTFLNRWSGLSPEAKAALYPDSTMRAQIDAAAGVSDRLKSVVKPNSAVSRIEGTDRSILGSLVGGAIGSGTGAMVSHLGGDPVIATLMASAGAAGGAATPRLAHSFRKLLADNQLLAKLAAAGKPAYGVPLQIPAVAGAAEEAQRPERNRLSINVP